MKTEYILKQLTKLDKEFERLSNRIDSGFCNGIEFNELCKRMDNIEGTINRIQKTTGVNYV